MVDQPEHPTFDPTVYELEVTDPVQGGLGGIANLPLLNLANRTLWLKQQLDLLIAGAIIPPTIAPLNGPAFTGSTTAPNVRPGDDSTLIANTDFVQTRHHGIAVVQVGGNQNVTLTQDQWGAGILVFQGVLTGPVAVLFPAAAGLWQVANRATGAFDLSCKTAAGTGVFVPGATPYLGIWCDGVSIFRQESAAIANQQVFRASGTFMVPASVTRVKVRLWGGGGGGGGSAGSPSAASGGGAGGYSEGIFVVTPGAAIPVTVGIFGITPGAGVGPINGTPGGTSSFGSFCSATGGGAGGGANSAFQGIVGFAGVGSGGTLNISGQSGSQGQQVSPTVGQGGAGGGAYGSQGGPGSIGAGGGGNFPGGGNAGNANGINAGGNAGGGCVIVEW